jgi:thymidylate kinase
MPVHDKFTMFEGIDGSGKTTVAKAFAHALAARKGLTIFDLPETSRKNGELPLPWVPGNEIIFSAEPTRTWVGAAIRSELTRTGTGYGGSTVAEAFALDRQILYTRFIVPMLDSGAAVVQDRGLPSSMAYQPIMEDSVTLEAILALKGNALALEHAPKHLVIAQCSAKTSVARLASRTEKNDDSIFERENFLTELAARYEAGWFREAWEKQGTRIIYIDAERSIEEVRAEASRLAEELYG